MTKNGLITVLTVFTFFLMTPVVFGNELTPKEILHRTDEARGNLEGVKWKLQVISVEKDRKEDRNLDVTARNREFFAILKAPPKVRGMILLNTEKNMWFASPSVRKPVPVSPRQKLIGGASYGDIAATNYAEDYDVASLQEEIVVGEECYVFDLKANKKSVTYDRIKYWVSKERLVGVKAEYFTVSGKKFKSAIFEYEHKILVRERPRPFISKMIIEDSFLEGNVTTMIFSEPVFGKVPNSIFDLNLLLMRTI